jgi:hypothetical protein
VSALDFLVMRVRVSLLMTQPEIIKYETGNTEAWICICGNQPPEDGFYPCDRAGNEMEPAGDWSGLYVCLRCGRIIEQSSLRVVGRNPSPELLA